MARTWKSLALGLGAATVLVSGLWLSCNSGPEITGTDSGFGGLKDQDKKDDEEEIDEDGELYDEDGNLREDRLGGDLEQATSDDVGIVYPTMDLTGHGNTTCGGDNYGVLGQYTNVIDGEKVDLNFYNGVISGAGKGQDKANKKIKEKLGQTIYTRITKEQRSEWKEKDYDLSPMAIYALTAVKTKAGLTFNFSQPLPVFPMPAAPSRYEELEKGPKMWQAEITGSASFTVQMTMSLISRSEDQVVVQFDTFIPQDVNRTLYEMWPLAKSAVYTMNPKMLEVQSINSVNWFNDSDSCRGPETLNITFKLCKKTMGDKVKEYPCQ